MFVVASKITLIPHLGFHCSQFEWPDVSWPSWELIRFWSSSVDITSFGSILTLWNRPNLSFPGIFLRIQRRNGLKFGMLMYSDYLQNWIDFGHGLLIFLILAFWRHFDSVKPVRFGVSTIVFRTLGRNGLKFDMLMYPDHLWTDYIWVKVCWFSSFWHHFKFVKQVKCAVSRHFHDNVWEKWV